MLVVCFLGVGSWALDYTSEIACCLYLLDCTCEIVCWVACWDVVGADSHTPSLSRAANQTVKVFSRNGEHAAAFVAAAAAALDGRGVEVVACETAEEAVRGSDIVCTLTGSPEPVVFGEWLAPGVHVNAVGSCTPRTAELDVACFETATHVYTGACRLWRLLCPRGLGVHPRDFLVV